MIGTTPRTRFLASVRSAEEAAIALAGGADIIDAKEPAEGALGDVPLPELAAILRAVAGRRPVSATIGDCPLDEAADRVVATATTRVDYVKIGFFGDASTEALARLNHLAARGTRLIAVLFADCAPQWELIPRLAALRFSGVMLDTARKGQGGLLSHLDKSDLARFIAEARSHGLLTGLAGSLTREDASALLPLRPDVLGFRGALCSGGSRAQSLDAARIRAMRALIPLLPSIDEPRSSILVSATARPS
jgi:(5-formylfuran-3-yl)methyl phosphate synthase